jgi:hypothetical protein
MNIKKEQRKIRLALKQFGKDKSLRKAAKNFRKISTQAID